MTFENRQEMRYEKKVIIPRWLKDDFLAYLKCHPFFFKKHYSSRQVNSIYFDDVHFTLFHDHLAGLPKRKKVRIRWYGAQRGLIHPSVEIKRRNGQVGHKVRYPLPCASLKSWLNPEECKEKLRQTSLPHEVAALFYAYHPVLLNTYTRSYWLSLDRKFRITIDVDLGFGALFGASFKKNTYHKDFMVIEIKYAKEDADKAFQVMRNFPFRLSRFSKYIFAVKSLF